VASGRSDVYVAAYTIRGAFKASLHESGIFRLAFTTQYFSTIRDRFPPAADRAVRKWRGPTTIRPGIRQFFIVALPATALRTYETVWESVEPVVWLTPPGDGEEINVALIGTMPDICVTGWPGKRAMGTELVGKLPLATGETLWLVSHRVAVSPDDATRVEAQLESAASITKSTPVDKRALMMGPTPDGVWWFRDVVV
jgi:hypothetical protein